MNLSVVRQGALRESERGPLAEGRLDLVEFEEGDEYVFSPRLAHRRDGPLGRAAKTFLVYPQERLQGAP